MCPLQYIAECYDEDADSYAKELHELDQLRNAACHPPTTVDGCNLLKRYFCQLHALHTRFPLIAERELLPPFVWRNQFTSGLSTSADPLFEQANVLYNYGALHTQLAALDARSTDDGIKLVCTHFQCAAWAFGHLRQAFGPFATGDLAPEILHFMENVCLAQAQECILQKSLIDQRKPGIVTKVTAQIIAYYNQAYGSLLNVSEDGSLADLLQVTNRVFRDSKARIQFHIAYLGCVLLLYRGQVAEEQQRMGERVAFFAAAAEKLKEAEKLAGKLRTPAEVAELMAFVGDVVAGKLKAGQGENEFIYHEQVPDVSTLAAVPAANLVKGIGFEVSDPAAAGKDIFRRLVPMKVHEASSVYSEEKAQLLRDVGDRVQTRDDECDKFMASLNVDAIQAEDSRSDGAPVLRLPQGLVDRCAELSAKPSAIPDLVAAMSRLAETCTDVEAMLAECRSVLEREERHELQFQQRTGVSRPSPGGHLFELSREAVKYGEAHARAGESNDTLRNAMALHLNNLKQLAKPLDELLLAVPVCREHIEPALLAELRALLAKVLEMKTQRVQLCGMLRAALADDDITTKVIVSADRSLESLFEAELAKHSATVSLIDQNLAAQPNILRALTDCYARCAVYIKATADVRQQRDAFYAGLASSYDVYDDLLGKSSKGMEFYRKLQVNIQRMLARVKAAHEVQEEERQQRLDAAAAKEAVPAAAAQTAAAASELPRYTPSMAVPTASVSSGAPKLKDYMRNGALINRNEIHHSHRSAFVPAVRPNPLGSETTVIGASAATATMTDSAYDATKTSSAFSMNEPPPPYVYGQQVFSGPGNFDANQQRPFGGTNDGPAHAPPPPYNAYGSGTDPTDSYNAFSQQHQLQFQQQHQQHHQPPQQQQQFHHQQQLPTPHSQTHSPYTPNAFATHSGVTQTMYTNVAAQSSGAGQQQQQQQQPFVGAPTAHQSQMPWQQQGQHAGIGAGGSSQVTYAYSDQQVQSFGANTLAGNVWHKHNQQQHQQQQQQQMSFPSPVPTPAPAPAPNAWVQQNTIAQQQPAQQTPQPNQYLSQQLVGMHLDASSSPAAGAVASPAATPTASVSSPYNTSSQPSYQLTANSQYVTGYDQTGSLYRTQSSSSYGTHPGYEFNQQSGLYQYGSGYQVSQS